MTLKQLILGVLTIIVVVLVGQSLITSWNEPQITSRLQLYQTDLLLQSAELQDETLEDTDLAPARTALLGENPIGTALEQYQSVRQSGQAALGKFQEKLDQLQAEGAPPQPTAISPTPTVVSPQRQQLQTVIQEQQQQLRQLDLRIAVLQTQTNDVSTALTTWNELAETPASNAEQEAIANTAQVLAGLWRNPPRILPDAEPKIQRNLEGWFRNQALTRLYELQQRPEALATLQSSQQAIAQQTLVKLALIGTVPLLGSMVGVGLLLFLGVQRLTKGKDSVLATNEGVRWETPWTWDTTLQVLIVGFFFVGQILLPLLLSNLGISFSAFGSRARAAYALTYYLLMAGSGLLVLYLSIRRFRPLPEGWFRFGGQSRWFLWGVGGYLTALPLMIGVSLLNQQLWQGQGGSNPLLQIVLEEGDRLALALFFFTAAVAAPVFEELLFRGFLLPSLTRYMPVWGAIATSSLIFAIAHLSVSEVIPLTVLGSVLGFIYTRSRNLLAPMLLHSFWNSATMAGLFILGSGTTP